MTETGSAVIHTAETTGSLFLASLAEGYFGADKLKLGSVDLRAPAGIAAVGFGLYETMAGKKTGGHALAIGNGVLCSWLASVASQAGRTLAEKRAAPPPEPALTLVPAIQGPAELPEPSPSPSPIASPGSTSSRSGPSAPSPCRSGSITARSSACSTTRGCPSRPVGVRAGAVLAKAR
jgi:hypothetical protein